MQLFPNKLKKPSGWVFYISVVLGFIYIFIFNREGINAEIWVPSLIHDDFLVKEPGFFIRNNIIDEILTVIIVVSGFLLGFSKEKVEDEYITKMRGESLVWSVFVNYGIVLLATLTIHGLYFLHVMMIQMFTILLVFNLRFYYRLRKHYRSEMSNEE